MFIFRNLICIAFCILIKSAIFPSQNKSILNKEKYKGEYVLNKNEQAILRNNLYSLNYYSLMNGVAISALGDKYTLVESGILQDEYKKDAKTANNKYLNKILVVFGEVKSISIDKKNANYVEFVNKKKSHYNLRANFQEGYDYFLKSYTKGEYLPIICECFGYKLDKVILNNCISPDQLVTSKLIMI